jgi:3'(2'), 5'-bisphosphate nucleotidase
MGRPRTDRSYLSALFGNRNCRQTLNRFPPAAGVTLGTMFEKELEAAIAVAREAGSAVSKFYEAEIIAEEKLGVDDFSEPVTAADRAASRIIVRRLAEAFPEDGILSEEEIDIPTDRRSKERVWIIDPIDGTAGFIKKDGDFAVQIGLAFRGEPVVGVVCLPAQGTMYYASRGGGSFALRGGAPLKLKVSGETDFEKISLAVSRDHRSPRMSRVVSRFGVRREVGRGSVGVKVGLIAEKTCDLYVHLSPRTKFWDTCGHQVILEEAGGRLTDLFGERIRYDREDVQNYNGILASNGAVHEKAVAGLAPLLAEFGRSKFLAEAA